MHTHATIALKAASMIPAWGKEACRIYCERHGCPTRLWYLARMLDAAQSIKEVTK